jgi:hypothetical protein
LLGLPLVTGLTPTVALAQFIFACVAMADFMFTHGLNIDENWECSPAQAYPAKVDFHLNF